MSTEQELVNLKLEFEELKCQFANLAALFGPQKEVVDELWLVVDNFRSEREQLLKDFDWIKNDLKRDVMLTLRSITEKLEKSSVEIFKHLDSIKTSFLQG